VLRAASGLRRPNITPKSQKRPVADLSTLCDARNRAGRLARKRDLDVTGYRAG